MAKEINKQLTDAELDDLADLLDSLPDAMSIEKMDGFLVSLACSQELVMPSSYLPEIWGPSHVWDSEEDAKKYSIFILRHWNHIIKVLSKADFYDILLNDYEGDHSGNEWAIGFMYGMKLTGDVWDDYINDDEQSGVFVPIFALAHENDPDPELRHHIKDEEERSKLLAFLCAFAPIIYKHMTENYPYDMHDEGGFAHHDYHGETTTFRREGKKIARNEPCPCGSGKKYKKCCGRN